MSRDHPIVAPATGFEDAAMAVYKRYRRLVPSGIVSQSLDEFDTKLVRKERRIIRAELHLLPEIVSAFEQYPIGLRCSAAVARELSERLGKRVSVGLVLWTVLVTGMWMRPIPPRIGRGMAYVPRIVIDPVQAQRAIRRWRMSPGGEC